MAVPPLHAPDIDRIVARQLGHITRAQLLAAGRSAHWIDHRVKTGYLIPVHAGVYAVGHVPRHAHARSVAAVLACGAGAALSHSAAAALWGAGEWPARLEVTAPVRRARPGIRTHRSARLGRGETRVHHGVRVTSPARTVHDLHPRLTDAGLARLVNELRVAGHLGESAFANLCRHSARVDRLLGERESGRTLTRSELERIFRAFLRHHGLPMPEFNVRLPETGREVDALYRDQGVILELDSWERHSDRLSFDGDRARDIDALALRYRTVRITARQLRHEGPHTAALLRQILGGAS